MKKNIFLYFGLIAKLSLAWCLTCWSGVFSCAKVIPQEMIFVKGGDFTVGDGIVHALYNVQINDFYLSKFEVTNREVVEVFNWALSKGMVIIDTAPRKYLWSDIGQNYDFDQLRVRRDEMAEWDLIDFGRPGGKIEYRNGQFLVLDGYEDFPANCVSWYGAITYCNWRSLLDGRKPAYTEPFGDDIAGADGYRLPSGEEWEYAARGGIKSKGYQYAGSDDALEVGWFLENSGNAMHPVGQKTPNELGLYDMSGNLAEMCCEKMGLYRGTILEAPGLSTEIRLWRGGSYSQAVSSVYYFYQIIDYPNYCHGFDNVGFRLKLKK